MANFIFCAVSCINWTNYDQRNLIIKTNAIPCILQNLDTINYNKLEFL